MIYRILLGLAGTMLTGEGLSLPLGGEAHGGDGYMHLFEKARLEAILIVDQHLTSENLPPDTSLRVRQWALSHRQEMSDDLVAADHQWELGREDDPCAESSRVPGATVEFSLASCRRRVKTEDEALHILLRVAASHLGANPPRFAAKVGEAIAATLDSEERRRVGVWKRFRSHNLPCLDQGDGPVYTVASWQDQFVVFGNHNVYDGTQPRRTPCGGMFSFEDRQWTPIELLDYDPDWKHLAKVLQRGSLLHALFVKDPFEDISTYRWQVFDFRSRQWSEPSLEFSTERIFVAPIVDMGSRFAIWGSVFNNGEERNSGFLYDPVADRWHPMNVDGAPEPRFAHSMVWTGDRLLVWGGLSNDSDRLDAGAYFPNEDRWQPIARPPGRFLGYDPSVSLWTGQLTFDFDLLQARRYDPSTDHWLPTPRPPVACRNYGAGFIWTGEWILAAGFDTLWKPQGLIFNIEGGRWHRMSLRNGPEAWPYFTPHRNAAWLGDRMIYYGKEYQGFFFPTLPSRSGA